MSFQTGQFLNRARRPAGGFIGLITVIIIGVLILITGLAASFTGQTQLIVAGGGDRAQTARQATQTCVEEALHRLRLDNGFTCTGLTVPVGELTCSVTVSGSAPTKTIVASAVDGDYTQSVSATAVLRTNTAANAKGWEIQGWQEDAP